MPAAYILKYRDGRELELYSHRGYYYVMGPDDLLSFNPIPVWCHDCDACTLGEPVRKPAEIEQEIRENADPFSERHRHFFSNYPPDVRAKKVAHLEAVLNRELTHAMQRKGPPRCIDCGKSRVFFFPDRVWFPHPKTGEEVFFEITGMCSTNWAMRFFDIEGKELKLSDAQQRHYFAKLKERGG